MKLGGNMKSTTAWELKKDQLIHLDGKSHRIEFVNKNTQEYSVTIKINGHFKVMGASQHCVVSNDLFGAIMKFEEGELDESKIIELIEEENDSNEIEYRRAA
jgi:hypothetical protein